MKNAVGANHVGGMLTKTGTTTFRSVNPATNEEIPVLFHQATEEEAAHALQLAQEAAALFADAPVMQRVELLGRIAKGLEENAGPLQHSFCLESGLPADRAAAELKRTCFQLTSYAAAVRSGYALHAVIDPADPERQPVPKPDLRKVNMPIGPVVVFGASNFPFAYSTAGGDTASAFAAGCPVIVKAHPMHAQTSELTAAIIAEAVQELGLPPGIFSHLHAVDFSVAEQLVMDDRVCAVGFTGSINGGLALQKMAQSRKRPIPVFAEMGSVNPITVLPEAVKNSPKEIAGKLVQSVGLNAGQFCTSPGLLFVIEGRGTDAFLYLLRDGLKDVPAQSMLHPRMKEQYLAARQKQYDSAQHLLVPEITPDNSITPALFSVTGKQFIAEPHRQEEVFGSFLQVVRCADQQEWVQCMSLLNGQLTASVFYDESEWKRAKAIIPLLREKVGRIIFNGVPTGVEVSPAQHHGGGFPASTDSRFTAVGADAIARFMHPVCFQNCPEELLPEPLKRTNPLGILRFVNGLLTSEPC